MSLTPLRSGMLLTALMLALSSAHAQPTGSPGSEAATAQPATKTFSQQDLDRLLAPIALYPDALLAQILMASTYPLEIVEAARWSKANAKLTGKALEEALAQQRWDPAVKSLTAVPKVLQQMDEKLDWTQQLGDAFLAQQKEVMASVQALRAKAVEAGNLKSSEQQVVTTQVQGGQTTYIIESPKPEVVYVPTYNPAVVYGAWPYPAPPYAVYPPAYVYPPGLAFATGVVVGAAIWGNCNWGHGNVDVNVNHYNNFNKTNVSNGNWQHNSEHRRGVAYKDSGVAQQYNRGANADAVKSRENYRGRTEGGRNEMQGQGGRNTVSARDNMARGGQSDRASASARDNANRSAQGDRGSGSSRESMERGGQRDAAGRADAGSGGRSAASGAANRSGGGFSGAGQGGATREASARGASSRGSAGGGSRGGGSRGGRR